MNEFQEAEQVALDATIKRKKDEIKEELGALLTRLEDVEHNQIALEETIKELTPSDDLEAVKMRLNQVISTINKLAV